MKNYKYCVLDVFTSERFKGNPLAVIFTDTDLALSEYEDISREFGYSETSFIYYSKNDRALKVRSFTATGFEINGAGHNLMGAVCAALLTGMKIFDEQNSEKFVVMKDELIHLSINTNAEGLLFVGMMQQPVVLKDLVPAEVIATALALDPDDVVFGSLVPTVAKTEVTHLMVPVRNLDILNQCLPDDALLIAAGHRYGFEGAYCFTILEDSSTHFLQSRFFNPMIGIAEDPATGSAAGPLAGYLHKNGLIRQNNAYQLLQGVKMNHPSTIRFEVTADGIWISGSSVIVMEGNIYIG